ncbi:amidohydrolase family protein, partial [Streptosporangium sp. NPDC001682]
RAEDLNNMPLNDPIGTLVLGSDPRNIDAVLIAGQVRKWAGTVLDIDLAGLREDVRASRDRVLAAAGYRHTRS